MLLWLALYVFCSDDIATAFLVACATVSIVVVIALITFIGPLEEFMGRRYGR